MSFRGRSLDYGPSRDLIGMTGILRWAFVCSKVEWRVMCQSVPERNACFLLAADPFVSTFVEQPTPVKWKDDSGVWRRHTPDFRFVRDGRVWMVEVKPEAKVAAISRRTEIVTEQLARDDITYEIWTDTWINREPRQENAQELWRWDMHEVNELLLMAVTMAFNTQMPRKLGELHDIVSHLAPRIGDLYHLAMRRHFWIDISAVPIGRDSPVVPLFNRVEALG